MKRGEDGHWQEVTKEEYMGAERAAGNQPDIYDTPREPVTSGFGSWTPKDQWIVRGYAVIPDSNPETYRDHDLELRELIWPGHDWTAST